MNLDTVRIPIEYECPTCQGVGRIHDAYCMICFYHLTPQDMEQGGETMPCGHSWGKTIEEPECPDCDGEGRRSDRITLSRLASLLEEEV